MTTRRSLLTLGAVAGAAAATGCSADNRGGSGAGAAVPGVVLAQTERGLAVLRDAQRQVFASAVLAPSGTAVYAATPVAGGRTRLTVVRTDTGAATATVVLDGAWVPRTVSPDGGVVALMPRAPSGTGRERTTMLIAHITGGAHRLELAGNVEPDAFDATGTRLFILDWQPPAAPDRYRVRTVDLTSGQPGPLLTRNKTPVPAGAEEEMHGEARQAVYAPNLSTVYTLYTNQPDHLHTRDLIAGHRDAPVPAFVHTLELEIGWAYCVDLPYPFGRGAAAAHTTAITPDGATLFVADHSSGQLAAIDTEALAVRRVVPVPAAGGTAGAAVAPDGRRLYLGCGRSLYTVDTSSLAVLARWDATGEVRGLAVSPDSTRLLVGYPGAVGWFTAATGAVLGRVPVPGLTHLHAALAGAGAPAGAPAPR
jgi:YVTN family beta-propeller protein